MGQINRRQAGEQQVVTLRVPIEVYTALKTLAFATGSSMNELGVRAISNLVAGEGHVELVDALGDRMKEEYQVALDKLASL